MSQDELDALLAPIALYPDGLLSKVLMASTYPLEVVQADRFVKQNSGLSGDALDQALAKRNWDPSVQSLVAYPKVLAMMSEKLEWTERMGSVVLEDLSRVMSQPVDLPRAAKGVLHRESSRRCPRRRNWQARARSATGHAHVTGNPVQNMVLIAAFLLLVFLYSLVSQRLERTVVTAPMLFTAAGAATVLLPQVRYVR